MNRKQKKILTVAAGIVNLSFTLTVAATATYAWFAENRRVSATGISVQCAVPDSKLNWEILRYDDDLKSGVSSTNVLDYYLDPYDQYITSRNVHSNVLLKATMTFDDGDLFDSGDQLYIDVKCTDETVYDENKHVRSLTSNIAQFKSTVGSYYTASDPDTPVVVNASIDETDTNTRYNTATTYFKSKSSSVPFLTVNNQTPNKTRRHQITLIPRFDCGSAKIKKLVVYIECSYKSSLVDFYLSSWGASLSGEIDLNGDITELNFRVGKSYSGAYVQVTDQSQLTSGDYIIGYDGHNAAMDGSLDDSSMDSSCNYIPVESKKGRIANTETTYNSRYTYSEDTGLLRSASGYNIGRASDSNGLDVNNDSSNTNTLSYSDGSSNVVSSSSANLRYNASKGDTRFGYYSSSTYTSQKSIQLYKYDASAVADVNLVSIAVSGNYTKTFYVGDTFAFGDGVITATYSDNTTSSISAEDCSFTGYDIRAIGNQVVTVTYTDEDITQSTTYNITVKNEPYVSLDYTTLKGTVGGSVTITATAHNFTNAVTWSWESSDTSTVTVTPDTTNPNKAVIGYIGATTSAVIITVTATDTLENESKSDTCSVTVNEKQTYKVTITYDNSGLPTSALTADTEKVYDIVDSSNNKISTFPLVWSTGCDNFKGTYTESKTQYNYFVVSAPAKGYIKSNSSIYVKTITIDNYKYENLTIYANDSGTGTAITGTEGASTDNYNSVVRTYEINSANWYMGNLTDKYYASVYSITFEVEVDTKSLARIEVTNTNKAEYFTDDEFVSPTVTAYYDNATSEDVSNKVTFTGNDLTTAGTKTVTVSYTENGVTVETSYVITVTESLLTGISVTPKTTIYYTGDTFEFDGTCTATYSSGKEKTVTPTSCTGYNMESPGKQTVTVTYTEGIISKTATYEISVSQLELTGLSIKNAPSKVTYNVGDTFNPAGTTLTASFNSGKTTTISNTSDYTYDKTSPLTEGDTKVTFSYTFNGVTKTAEQTITVNKASISIKKNSTEVTSLEGVAETTMEGLTVTSSNFTNAVTYTWTSSDATTVKVEATTNTANLFLYKVGTATITCTASDGTQSASKSFTVTVTPITVAISEETATVAVSKTVQLNGATNSGTITWSSSNTDVATVDSNGLVTGVAPGDAIITASAGSNSNQVTDTCTVTVTELHEITLEAEANSVYVDKSITISASCATSSCSISDWSITSGGTYATLVGNNGEATLTGLAVGDVVVRATCAHGEYAEITIKVITATDHTYTWTASSESDLGTSANATVTLSGVEWSVTRTLGTYTAWENTGFIQLGSKKNTDSEVKLTTNKISGVIKSISTVCASYNGNHKLTVSVGNTTYLSSASLKSWTSSSTITATGTSSGEIVLSFADGQGALYIKSITIIYNN